jgi:leucyl-tRNA synthetase
VNATRKAIDSGVGPADAAVREAAEVTALTLNLFSPYTAEDMWQHLGHEPAVALVPWRTADPALLVEESVTAVVQVDGKVRDRLEVPPTIADADLEQQARASAAVTRAIGERQVVKVIVRAPRLVSIVTKP